MSDSLNDWFEAWGDWLDELLANGLAYPASGVRQRIERWCVDAELLGFAEQAQLARELIGEGGMSTSQCFQRLLMEQDMLERLYQLEAWVPQRVD